MDIKICISVVTVLGFLQGASAGCAQDIMSNQGFTECIMGYSMFMGNAAGSIDPSDTEAMMAVMCSAEGKAAMQCVVGFVKSCPDLMTSADTADMMQGFKELDKNGGFDSLCDMVSGPCQAVSTCLMNIGMNDSSPMLSYPTPFNAYQDSIRAVCGPVKAAFDCFKDAGDKCTDLEASIQTALDMGRKEAPQGVTVPSFKETKMFVKNECPKLPSDLGTNTCLKNQLMSDEYMTCFADVAKKHPDFNCDSFKEGYECLKKTVGENCGSRYVNAFVKISPLFLTGVPADCRVGASHKGASSIVQMSVLSIVVALLLAFKLK